MRTSATGPQLWRLNKLGVIDNAKDDDGHVYADRANEVLAEAAAEGLWKPKERSRDRKSAGDVSRSTVTTAEQALEPGSEPTSVRS
jgi:hypothetical protein